MPLMHHSLNFIICEYRHGVHLKHFMALLNLGYNKTNSVTTLGIYLH